MEEKEKNRSIKRFTLCQKIALVVSVHAVLFFPLLYTTMLFLEEKWAMPFWYGLVIETWFSITPDMGIVFLLTLIYAIIKRHTPEGEKIFDIYRIALLLLFLFPILLMIFHSF